MGRLSSYSPPDLFSHDASRVKQALSALLADPQNNLRVYADGVPVIDECQGGFAKGEGAEVLRRVVEKGRAGGREVGLGGECEEGFCEVVGWVLRESGALQEVERAQSR